MTLNEFIRWQNKIAKQHTRLYSSSGAVAMAMNPSLIEFVEQTNEMMKVISPPVLDMANRVAEINRIPSPALFNMSQRASEIANIISPVIYEAAQQSKILADALSPALINAAQFAQKVKIELNPLIQQMEQARIRWSDIGSFSTTLTGIIESNPYIEDLEDDIDKFSLQEKEEIESAVIEIISEPFNWQQSIVSCFESFKSRNPLLSKLFIWVLSTIIAIIVGAASDILANVIKDANLKEAPTPTAPIITNLVINQSVYITNKAPYYFEVEFIDEQSGETIKGWISKRSLKPYNTDDEQPKITENELPISEEKPIND
ncbi:hypothetical protein [Lutispora saccharofermentans]|uniref:SH3 domain-containing protein n=1 Tax=Lutispora saccharofermentans TaxID=3024236 RepID=A0ABT1NAP6_9FIRM|nr:hypothetical protein [Lutispora saccharofermentans]MCQ1528307.1 hypothetical protein [Lutispora saccharofermentans]